MKKLFFNKIELKSKLLLINSIIRDASSSLMMLLISASCDFNFVFFKQQFKP